MKANKYIIRYGLWENGPGSGYRTHEVRVWAFSAEDAKIQIETWHKDNRNVGPISYVGPFIHGCGCLHECHCGVVAPL